MRHSFVRGSVSSVVLLGLLQACSVETVNAPASVRDPSEPTPAGEASLPPPSQAGPPAPPPPKEVHGVLDPTFGTKGKFNFASTIAGVDMAVGEDDAIYVIGRAPDDSMMALAKFSPNGAADTTFGFGGARPVAPPQGAKWRGTSALALANGKIYVASFATEERGVEVRALLADGKPDTSFGNAGEATLKFASGYTFDDGRISVGANGRIFVGGRSNISIGYADFAVGSFSNDGKESKSLALLPGTPAEARGATGSITSGFVDALVPVGQDVWAVGGQEVKLAGTGKYDYRPAVRVVRSNGQLDTVPFTGSGFFRAAWDAGDGNVLAVGVVDGALAVGRATAKAEVDKGFGKDGILSLGAPCDGELADALPDGKGGIFVLAACASDAALVHVDAKGAPDADFGKGGTLRVAVANAARLRTQKNGLLLVVGSSSVARVKP